MRQAVILAGGKGTRLRERLGGRPKPLVDLGGQPLLQRQMELLVRYGFQRVLVLVNHKAEQIVEFCEAHGGWGMDVECIDDGTPLGTAGATLAVVDKLEQEALIVYGDTMLEVDLDRFYNFHALVPDAAATLFLHPNDHPHDSDLVEVDDEGRVLAFHPYPHDEGRDYANLVNAALYWVKRDGLMPWRGTPGQLDFGKNLFPMMLDRGQVLLGYNSPEYIKDCGTPERLDKVERHLASGKIKRSSLHHQQAVVFLDRDGTINREANHLNHPDQLELIPGTAEAIRRLNQSDYRTVVVTNQPVVARGECSFEGLKAIHARLETLLGRGGAYLDRIYFCPHHPHRGYEGERPELKIECECRKPATGMLDQAAEDFNLDRARSWLVGDSTVDLETARRAGLRSVAVETGYGARDGRIAVEPDYVAEDLGDAVRLILDRHPLLLARCAPYAQAIGPGELVQVVGLTQSRWEAFASGLKEALRQHGRSAHRFVLEKDAPSAELMSWLHDFREQVSTPLAGGDGGRVSPEDVVILAGEGALNVPGITRSYLVESSEPERRARALRGLARRGVSPEEAERIEAEERAALLARFESNAAGAERVTLDEVFA